MKPLQIYLTEEQHKALREIYAETGRPMAEFIRMAIDAVIEKYYKEKKVKK